MITRSLAFVLLFCSVTSAQVYEQCHRCGGAETLSGRPDTTGSAAAVWLPAGLSAISAVLLPAAADAALFRRISGARRLPGGRMGLRTQVPDSRGVSQVQGGAWHTGSLFDRAGQSGGGGLEQSTRPGDGPDLLLGSAAAGRVRLLYGSAW